MRLLPSRTTARENSSQKFKNWYQFFSQVKALISWLLFWASKKNYDSGILPAGAFFSRHCQCFLQSFAGFFLLLLNRNFFSFLHANLPANTCIKQSVTGKVIMLYFMTPWAWKTERTKKRYNEMGPRRIPL